MTWGTRERQCQEGGGKAGQTAFIDAGKEDFTTEDILRFLEENPKLEDINSMIGRNEGLQKSLKDDYKMDLHEVWHG